MPKSLEHHCFTQHMYFTSSLTVRAPRLGRIGELCVILQPCHRLDNWKVQRDVRWDPRSHWCNHCWNWLCCHSCLFYTQNVRRRKKVNRAHLNTDFFFLFLLFFFPWQHAWLETGEELVFPCQKFMDYSASACRWNVVFCCREETQSTSPRPGTTNNAHLIPDLTDHEREEKMAGTSVWLSIRTNLITCNHTEQFNKVTVIYRFLIISKEAYYWVSISTDLFKNRLHLFLNLKSWIDLQVSFRGPGISAWSVYACPLVWA